MTEAEKGLCLSKWRRKFYRRLAIKGFFHGIGRRAKVFLRLIEPCCGARKGSHRFGCSVGGKRSLTLPAVRAGEGFRVKGDT